MDLVTILAKTGNSVSCNGWTIDPILPAVTATLVTVIKIGIPIALVFLGMLDLGKAVMANDEKVMKEAQSRLIKRFIYAIIIFILVAIVQLVFSMIGSASTDSDNQVDNENIASCIDLFVNGPDNHKKTG